MWKALSVAEKATYHIEGVVDTKARTRLVAVPPPAAPPAAPPVTLPTAPSNAPTPSTSTQLQLQLAQSLQRMTGDEAVDLVDDVILNTPGTDASYHPQQNLWPFLPSPAPRWPPPPPPLSPPPPAHDA